MSKGTSSLNEIADRIVEAILNEKIIDKENLRSIIRPLLIIWLNNYNLFKSHKASKGKLQQTIDSREFQQKFWRKEFINVVGIDNIEPYNIKLNAMMVEHGYKKK